jgi:O-antigen/teichoic acid export membrane protein
MMSFGVRGLFGYISPVESFRLDQLIAGLFLSPAALGLYVVGQAFTNLPKFLGQSVSLIVFPVISGQKEKKTAVRVIRRAVLAVLAFNSLIVVPLILAMPVLILFFFGEEFRSSVPLARILLLGAVLLSARRAIVEGQRGLGRPEVSTCAELIMYPALAIAAPLLIGWYGINGLAWAVVTGHATALVYASMVQFRSGLDEA